MKFTPVLGFISKGSDILRFLSLPLLHHLQRSTEDCSAKVGVGLAETTRETLHPAGNEVGSWDDRTLVFLVGDNLSQFVLDIIRVDWVSTKSAESITGLLELTSLDEITWGIWESHQSTGKDKSPCELDGNWDTVVSGI